MVKNYSDIQSNVNNNSSQSNVNNNSSTQTNINNNSVLTTSEEEMQQCCTCGTSSKDIRSVDSCYYGSLALCEDCIFDAKKCICGVPAASKDDQRFTGAKEYPSGGTVRDYRCRFCSRRRIRHVPLYQMICVWFNSSDGPAGILQDPDFKLPHNPYFVTRTFKELQEGGQEATNNRQADGYYDPVCDTMFTLRGLSRVWFIRLVAHELTHAWQFQAGFEGQLKVFYEGFAQWVAFKCVEAALYKDEWIKAFEIDLMDQADGEYLLSAIGNSPDQEYGKGLCFYLWCKEKHPAEFVAAAKGNMILLLKDYKWPLEPKKKKKKKVVIS